MCLFNVWHVVKSLNEALVFFHSGDTSVPTHVLLLFTCSTYCSCPHKVHTVACSMHTTGTYYSWCSYIRCSLSAKIWSTSWARLYSETFYGYSHSNVTYHLHSFIHSALCINNILIVHGSRKTYVELTLNGTVICHCGTCHTVNHLSSVWRDVCDIFSSAQRIVGQNGQKSMLACILQNPTGCSGTSWYFWHTVLHILCTGTY